MRSQVSFNREQIVDQDDFSALVRALQRARGFALYFVKCNVPAYREEVAEVVRDHLERPVVNVNIRNIERGPKRPSIDYVLEQQLTDVSDDTIIFAWDLEKFLPSKEKEKDVKRHTLTEVNWRRSAFARLDHPLVFWLPEYAIRYLTRDAPDFFDWNSGLYVFEVPEEERSTLLETPRKMPEPTGELLPLPGMAEGHADHFIGRRREQERILPKLRSGDLNTVLITGLGGVGKSTLATSLARELEKDGFVPIAVSGTEGNPLTAGRILDRCYEAFLAEDPNGPYRRLQSEEIGLQDKLRLLVQLLNRNQFTLVLDNFERNVNRESHEVLNNDLVWFLSYLLDNLTGSSRCLVTSRYRPAEVDELPPGAEELSLADFSESAFFKYLLDDDTIRRRCRDGDLPRDLLSRLYNLFGGAPRFLEQVREVLRDISGEELENMLDTAQLPEDAAKDRLQELRDVYIDDLFIRKLHAAIEPPEAREALSRAAVYTIPMTVEGYAVAADVDETNVQDWLDVWRRHTFVATVQTADAVDERWIIPEVLRPLLLDQINEDKRKEAHRAAGTWLSEVIEADRERDHLGMDWLEVGLESRSRFLDAEEYSRAREITDRISGLFFRRALYDDVIRLNKEILKRERHPHSMNWLGRVYRTRGKYSKAKRWYRDAVKVAGTGDRQELATAHHGIALIAAEKEEYRRAQKEFEKAFRIYREIGNRSGEASTRHQMATVLVEQGEYERAQKAFMDALEIRREIEDRSGEASTRHQLATVALEQGDYERAREEFEKALWIYQELGDRSGEASVRHNLASMTRNQGDYERARREYEEALRIYYEVGDRGEEAATWQNLARIALEQGDYAEARENFEEALRIYYEVGDRSGEAAAQQNLARIALEEGDYEEARYHFEEALRIRQKIGDRSGEAAALQDLARTALEQGDYEEARAEFLQSLEIKQEIEDRSGEAATFSQLGNVAHSLDNARGALQLHLLSFQILDAIGHRQQQTAWSHVSSLASDLELSEDELENIAEKVAESYAEDRGSSLIQEAFPDADLPDDVPPSGDSE